MNEIKSGHEIFTVYCRFFPEGWAKRVNMPGRTNDIATMSNLGKENLVSDIFSEYNNSERCTQAVDRIIESIQQRRRLTQVTVSCTSGITFTLLSWHMSAETWASLIQLMSVCEFKII